jgi:hypothetical protein
MTEETNQAQLQREPVLKLLTEKHTSEHISEKLQVQVEFVMQVIEEAAAAQSIIKDIQQQSMDFRCTVTHKLVRNPVVSSDGRLYERQQLEALEAEEASSSQGVVVPELKQSIQEFSRRAFERLVPALQQGAEVDAALIAE